MDTRRDPVARDALATPDLRRLAGLAAPLTGLAADRFPRRDVLLVAVVARVILLGAAALVVALQRALRAAAPAGGAVHDRRDRSQPAPAALLPRLAPLVRSRPPRTRCGRGSTAAS